MKAQETDEAPICPLCTNVLRVHDYLLTPDELIIFDSLVVKAISFHYKRFFYSQKRIEKETRATKKEFCSTKREMARLRKAIGDAGNCKHSGDCPVLFRLREHPKDGEGDLPDGGESDGGGQYGQRSPPCTDGGGPEVGGTAGDTG